MFVLSSPSGAGKTTLARMLVASDPQLRLSVSATTRPQRPAETSGVDYHFIGRDEFLDLQTGEGFLEWASVFGHYYGTPRRPVEQALSEGLDVLFDIDWQGAQQLRAAAPDDVASVFILPPSSAVLASRLRARATDDEAAIARRLAEASAEMSHWAEYDYVIVNDDLNDCAARLRAIVTAERLRTGRSAHLRPLIANLLGG
jgi:guanylate kinase